jgi:hypothetical protein
LVEILFSAPTFLELCFGIYVLWIRKLHMMKSANWYTLSCDNALQRPRLAGGRSQHMVLSQPMVLSLLGVLSQPGVLL